MNEEEGVETNAQVKQRRTTESSRKRNKNKRRWIEQRPEKKQSQVEDERVNKKPSGNRTKKNVR